MRTFIKFTMKIAVFKSTHNCSIGILQSSDIVTQASYETYEYGFGEYCQSSLVVSTTQLFQLEYD